MNFDTLCIHGDTQTKDSAGSISHPIYMTSSFSHPGVGLSTGYDYSREKNPTREQLEQIVCGLEQGDDAIAYSSGMAAISCVMELFQPGDHIISGWDLYGGSIRLFQSISSKNGILFTSVDTSDLDCVRLAIRPETKAIFIETPSNPMMTITDLAEIVHLASEMGILVIVDNTFLTPYFQKPLVLGADIVLHSGTKYLGGHNDVLSGFTICKNPEISQKLRQIYKTTGGCLSPFDSWLMLRGLKTLHLRMERHQENAIELANWLKNCSWVKQVFYPGLSDHKGYEIQKKQATGFGGMISFETNTPEQAIQLLQNIKLILFAESLGGAETLLTYPIKQTHADVPEEECIKKGINNRLLRLSTGLESSKDLIQDLAQAGGSF